MSYNYNHCTLVGHISNTPEFRQVTDNFCKLVFTIAVNRPYRKEEGSNRADFIPVLITGNLAIVGKNLLHKGDALLVWGSINVRTYEKDKTRRWITELSAANFQTLSKNKFNSNKVPSMKDADPGLKEVINIKRDTE